MLGFRDGILAALKLFGSLLGGEGGTVLRRGGRGGSTRKRGARQSPSTCRELKSRSVSEPWAPPLPNGDNQGASQSWWGPRETTRLQEEGSQETFSFAGCGKGPGDAVSTVQYCHRCQQGMAWRSQA